MFRFIGPLVLSATAALSGCGQGNDYGAAEASLREWLTAVQDRDATACDLMTADYRQNLAAGGGGREKGDCQLLMKSGLGALEELPPADAELDVPAWDPTGEALVEATDGGQVTGFWMEYVDGQWLVADRAG